MIGSFFLPGAPKRPQLLGPHEQKILRKPSPRKKCPFEDLQKSGNGEIFEAWPNEKKWKIAVVPNKYPALVHGETCAVDFKKGFYEAKTGIGTHELSITRDHNKFFADLEPFGRGRSTQDISESLSCRERRLQCVCRRVSELRAVGGRIALASALPAPCNPVRSAPCFPFAPRRPGIFQK